MTKKITLGPTLVILVGPSGSGKSTFAKQFPVSEIVSADALREELLGDFRRQDANDLIMNEFDRRILLRLEAGLRVVADASHLRDSARKRTARLAAKFGANLIYVVIDRPLMAKMKTAGWRSNVRINGTELVVAHDATFNANIGKILNGDGLGALVVDTRKEVPEIVVPLARDTLDDARPLYDIHSRGYNGILVVGDVHGNMSGLRRMIEFADKNKLFPLFMGDIVDYYPETLETADVVADMMFKGLAASVMGNHERKIFRYVTKERGEGVFATEGGYAGELSHGNDVTVNQLKVMGAASAADRLRWETRFIGMYGLMPHAIIFPRYFFTHGAANPRMLTMDVFRYPPDSVEESLAVFGETTGKVVNGIPERIYNWVNAIPPRQTVVVGHDCRCETYPFIAAGEAGGRAVFLDTGSSKPDRFPEGRLSAMALTIESKKKIGFVLENERFYSEMEI